MFSPREGSDGWKAINSGMSGCALSAILKLTTQAENLARRKCRAKPHDVQLKEMGMEPCWHVWVQIGLWSDRLYMSNPILQCKICGQKQYVSKRDDD